MKHSYYLLLLIIGALNISQSLAKNASGFCLKAGQPVAVVCDTVSEAKVVANALKLWLTDYESVLSIKPQIVPNGQTKDTRQTKANRQTKDTRQTKTNGQKTPNSICQGDIYIGTFSENPAIRQLLAEKHISADELIKKKEAFLLCVVQHQSKPILVVVGSDKRGTAYGIMELSRLIGISPWTWWADVTPAPIAEWKLQEDYHQIQSPLVEFRGIFINDEDWGLQPWSTKTYEPSDVKGNIGPKTHQRIFELLLRLRANTYWPAMHECSRPFYFTPGNAEMADAYGIYIGTSHCEPMMRNTNGEWKTAGKGEYDYVHNREAVVDFWKQRVNEVGRQDNIFTLGIRGVHDGKMQGAKTVQEQKTALIGVLEDQRRLLKEYVNRDVTKVPQVFIPYKEVLDVYNAGLKVPEDITLMWCDDNYGYIRHFPTATERLRKGGNGVYYHVSYWGRPHDHLWLGTAHPSLIYQQMKLAYNSGIQKMWILNVGDIKPSEYQIELFMDMAWNMDAVASIGVKGHLQQWLSCQFGNEHSKQILPLMLEHYRLAYIRKPEFMGHTRTEEKDPAYQVISDLPWNEETINERLKAYDALSDKVEKLEQKQSKERIDAYFELVKYPLQAATQMNHKLLKAQLARHQKADWAESDAAYDSIITLTNRYNTMIDGKWNRMMDCKPRSLSVFNRVKREQRSDVLPAYTQPLYIFNGADYAQSNGEKPQIYEELGYGGKAVALPQGASTTYLLKKLSADSIVIELRLLPNHPVNSDKLRFTISLDDQPAKTIEYQTYDRSEEWKENVLRNQAVRRSVWKVDSKVDPKVNSKAYSKVGSKGNVQLTLKALDAGVVIDQLLIYDKKDFKE